MAVARDRGRATGKKASPFAQLLMEELRNSPAAAGLDVDADATAIADLLSNRAIRDELARELALLRFDRAREDEQARTDLDFAAKALPYRVRNLLAARDEARAIVALGTTWPMRALRQTLNDHPPSAEAVFWLMFESRRQTARASAKSKNAAPRAFVVKEWEERTDRGQSKASFARIVAPRVWKKFSVKVMPDQIARYWLPRE